MRHVPTDTLSKNGAPTVPLPVQSRAVIERMGTNSFLLSAHSVFPTLKIAGAGAEVRSAFQKLMFAHAQGALRGRIILTVLPEEGADPEQAMSNSKAENMSACDALVLRGGSFGQGVSSERAFEIIRSFCLSNGAWLVPDSVGAQ